MDNKEVWIKEGYEVFSTYGPTGIKIEPLAKRVGKSKSSFYHHFADMEIFIDHLLEYHIQQSKIMAQKEQQAENIDPELIQILVAHKIDLLFNRQLKINQHIKSFSLALEKSNSLVGNTFITVWVKDLDLNLSPKQIEGIFSLALENFFLQINTETLHYEWLNRYFANLKKIACSFS